MTTNSTQKMLCLLNPGYFIEKVLGYDCRPHHSNILTNVSTHMISLDLAPRGFGKSTIGDVSYCISKIVQNRNIRILIVSNTQTQAQAFVREISNQLGGNEKLVDLFGSFSENSAKWTEAELTVSGRTSPKKESTLTALGASGSVISKHFDIIIADDICDFENCRTELQRKKLSEWYRTALLPTLEPGTGELHILGTRYHPYDLYQDMIATGLYQVQVQSAINNDSSLWPEKFTLDELLTKKSELGSLIFNLQYQNDISLAKQGHIFRYEWMQFYEVAPVNLKIYQGVDLAISDKETADYFVLLTIGFEQATGLYYVLDIYRERISFNQQVGVIKHKAEQWNPLSIGIESNAYQKALGNELIRTTSLPIKQLTTQKDKVSRAQRRSALFENGKIRIRKDMTALIDELCLFPDAAHDDMFDALDIALSTHDLMNVRKPAIPYLGGSYMAFKDGTNSGGAVGFDRYLETQRLRTKALSQPKYKSGVY
jgi:predicted phage terminase large subunit-like protein